MLSNHPCSISFGLLLRQIPFQPRPQDDLVVVVVRVHLFFLINLELDPHAPRLCCGAVVLSLLVLALELGCC